MDTIIEKKSFFKELMNNRKKLIKYVIILFILIFTFQLISENSVSADLVRIAEVKRANLKTEVEGTGFVKSASVILFYSPSSTFIKRVIRKEGELVQNGDTILVLDDTELRNKVFELSNKIRINRNNLLNKEIEYEQQLVLNQKNKEKFQTNLEQHQYELKAAEKLYEMGAVSESNVLAKKAELKNDKIDLKFLEKTQKLADKKLKQEINTLKLNISIQKQELQFFKKKLSETILIANHDGALIKQPFEAGEKVDKNQLIVQLSNQKDYLIEAQFSQRQFDLLEVGMSATLSINNKKYPARLNLLQPEIKNGYGVAELRFQNLKNSKIRQNQRVNILVETGLKENTLVVERGAFLSSGGNFTFKVIESKAEKVQIQTGGKNYQLVEILSGLKEGDRIVVSSIEDYLEWDEFTIN